MCHEYRTMSFILEGKKIWENRMKEKLRKKNQTKKGNLGRVGIILGKWKTSTGKIVFPMTVLDLS